MSDRRNAGDFDRDWSHAGPDYRRVGSDGLFRQPSRREHTDDGDGRRARDDEWRFTADDWRGTGLARDPYFPAAPHRGRFFGRGPKGYRRSDERIKEEISDRLMGHPDVDASDVEVQVSNGIVTLTCTIENRHEKRITEYLAEDTLGVDDVNNQLKVRHGFWAGLTGDKARADDR